MCCTCYYKLSIKKNDFYRFSIDVLVDNIYENFQLNKNLNYIIHYSDIGINYLIRDMIVKNF